MTPGRRARPPRVARRTTSTPSTPTRALPQYARPRDDHSRPPTGRSHPPARSTGMPTRPTTPPTRLRGAQAGETAPRRATGTGTRARTTSVHAPPACTRAEYARRPAASQAIEEGRRAARKRAPPQHAQRQRAPTHPRLPTTRSRPLTTRPCPLVARGHPHLTSVHASPSAAHDKQQARQARARRPRGEQAARPTRPRDQQAPPSRALSRPLNRARALPAHGQHDWLALSSGQPRHQGEHITFIPRDGSEGRCEGSARGGARAVRGARGSRGARMRVHARTLDRGA